MIFHFSDLVWVLGNPILGYLGLICRFFFEGDLCLRSRVTLANWPRRWWFWRSKNSNRFCFWFLSGGGSLEWEKNEVQPGTCATKNVYYSPHGSIHQCSFSGSLRTFEAIKRLLGAANRLRNSDLARKMSVRALTLGSQQTFFKKMNGWRNSFLKLIRLHIFMMFMYIVWLCAIKKSAEYFVDSWWILFCFFWG